MTRFDRIETGEALPVLQTDITREDLVRYAGGADDYVRQHWDHPFMIESGFPDVIVHGWLTFAHMCRAVEAWLTPEEAASRNFRCAISRRPIPARCPAAARLFRANATAS